MIKKDTKLIGLNELELTNDDLFIRKGVTGLDVDTKIIVDETHVAILLKNGIALETLRPGIYPVFDKKIGFSKNEKVGTFRVELFYISKTSKIRILWGTPALFDIHDPITNVSAKMGANGEIEIRVKNPRQFYLEVVGVNKKFSAADLKDRIKGRILALIEPTIAQYIEDNSIPLSRVSEEKLSIATTLEKVISKTLSREYGLEVASFTINNVNISDKYLSQVNESMNNAENKICPHCGLEVAAGSKFCNNCGTRIG